MSHEFRNASAAFKKLNPHLFGVGGLQASKPKPAQRSEVQTGKLEGGQRGVVYRVTFVLHLRKPYDDDNVVSSCKQIRDAVAESLRIDDGDPRIKFQYNQIRTEGSEGVNVIIETYD